MAKAKKPSIPKEIEFDFIKSNFFRVIRADGAFGGLAPNGSIHMSIYSERQAIPTKIVHKVVGNALGPELRREGRKAIVREVEIDIVMDIQQALVMRTWLDQKITQFEKATGTRVTDKKTNGEGPKK